MLFPTLPALAIIAHLAATPPQVASRPPARAAETVTCSIPLKELRIQNPNRIDPIELPHAPFVFDRIVHPTPAPACKLAGKE